MDRVMRQATALVVCRFQKGKRVIVREVHRFQRGIQELATASMVRAMRVVTATAMTITLGLTMVMIMEMRAKVCHTPSEGRLRGRLFVSGTANSHPTIAPIPSRLYYYPVRCSRLNLI